MDGISFRTPYQSDPIMRNKINEGISEYADIHLSHLAPMVWQGSMGKLDVAVIEVTAIDRGRRTDPVVVVGNNKTYLQEAEHIILEVELLAEPRPGGHARHLLRCGACRRTACRCR